MLHVCHIDETEEFKYWFSALCEEKYLKIGTLLKVQCVTTSESESTSFSPERVTIFLTPKLFLVLVYCSWNLEWTKGLFIKDNQVSLSFCCCTGSGKEGMNFTCDAKCYFPHFLLAHTQSHAKLLKYN